MSSENQRLEFMICICSNLKLFISVFLDLWTQILKNGHLPEVFVNKVDFDVTGPAKEI
jgi:hypothetical protein